MSPLRRLTWPNAKMASLHLIAPVICPPTEWRGAHWSAGWASRQARVRKVPARRIPSRSAGSESRSRRWLPSGSRSVQSPGWKRSPTSLLPACSGAARGRGRAPPWVWSSPEQPRRPRRQPGRQRRPPRRRRGPHQGRRRCRSVFPQRPRRRERFRAPRPQPQPRLAHRPRPLGGSDVGLVAYLERAAAASQHARTSETQHCYSRQ